MFKIPPPDNRAAYEIMWVKNGRTGQAIDGNTVLEVSDASIRSVQTDLKRTIVQAVGRQPLTAEARV